MAKVQSNPSSNRATIAQLLPPSTIIKLVVAWCVVIAFQIFGHTWLHAPIDPVVAIVAFVVLFATILVAAFGVVHEADHLAHSLGEPYGTLILTLSIVSIEVILIAAVILGPGENPTIARDSIFAVMMIILNLVTGLALLLGGLRYGEQEYNTQGALAYVAITLVLVGIGLLLPNTLSTGDGTFWPVQAMAFAVLTVILYGAFLLMQMRGYRRFFVQPALGALTIPLASSEQTGKSKSGVSIDVRGNIIRSITLLALILPIVLLAHDLAILIDFGIESADAPLALGGVIIAIIVFTPESITAIRAALGNEMQRAVNLCLGAFVSTVGLTIPAVLIVGLVTGKTVVMGISSTETVLLALTISVTAFTFLGQRTSAVQGLLHLMLFAVYAVLLFVT